MNIKNLTIMTLLPLAVSCGNGGTSTDSTQNQQATGTQPVVKHFDIDVANVNPSSRGVCGDSFTVTISSDGKVRAKSITLKVDGKQLDPLPEGDTAFVFSTQGMRCGSIPIIAQVDFPDGQEYLSRSIRLLSDIQPAIQSFKVLESYPHDADAYTQGLVFDGGVFYESTGLNGKSSLRKVDIKSGKVQQGYTLDNAYFGEGLAMSGDKLYQLTWRSHKAFVYDKQTFRPLGEFYLPTEGWGLTAISSDTLLLTDGTENLYFVDPNSFAILKTIQVYDNVGPLERLNETELYKGHLLANIYQTDLIAEIDINTGKLLKMINLEGILPDNLRSEQTDVLNGIAYDKASDKLYITGKNWPKMYLIKIIDTK